MPNQNSDKQYNEKYLNMIKIIKPKEKYKYKL